MGYWWEFAEASSRRNAWAMGGRGSQQGGTGSRRELGAGTCEDAAWRACGGTATRPRAGSGARSADG